MHTKETLKRYLLAFNGYKAATNAQICFKYVPIERLHASKLFGCEIMSFIGTLCCYLFLLITPNLFYDCSGVQKKMPTDPPYKQFQRNLTA